MKKGDLLKLVSDWMDEIIEGTDLEVVDIEYVKEGGTYFLRVYIDKPGGVNVDDCRDVTLKLSDLLDEADPISHAYTLEVSSPGIERPLKKPEDYARFIGRKINVRTYQAIDGRKQFEGKLTAFDSGIVTLDIQGKQYEIPHDQIAKARLAVEF